MPGIPKATTVWVSTVEVFAGDAGIGFDVGGPAIGPPNGAGTDQTDHIGPAPGNASPNTKRIAGYGFAAQLIAAGMTAAGVLTSIKLTSVACDRNAFGATLSAQMGTVGEGNVDIESDLSPSSGAMGNAGLFGTMIYEDMTVGNYTAEMLLDDVNFKITLYFYQFGSGVEQSDPSLDAMGLIVEWDEPAPAPSLKHDQKIGFRLGGGL